MADELVLDAWSPLSHKRGLSGEGRAWTAPTWTGDHGRRLAAYRILQSYIDNTARHFSQAVTPKDRDARREFGDAALLVHVARSKLLGDDISIVVEGADEELADDTAPEDAGRIGAARERQEWLNDWARAVRFRLKMIEVEGDAVGLGDGVYVLGWSASRRRPVLRLFDPGFYFPVLDDGDEDDYPSTVHIAWELPKTDEDSRTRIRRITYRLVPADADWRPPYAGPDDPPSTRICQLSDGIFTIGGRDRDPDALSLERAEWLLNEDGAQIRDLDLGIDFIPVVHVPNTVALKEHYGRSILASVAQVLDDIHATDTDISRAAATAGSPPITASGLALPSANGDTARGGQPQVATYGPGQMYSLGDNGRMDVLDTSGGLRALLELEDALLRRLSVNARIPEEVLGRINAGDVASGFLMALSFGPLQGLIDEMRLVRDEKYRLLLKFAQRLAVTAGELPAGPTLDAWVAFGSYLPSDLPGVVTSVTQLLAAKAVSRQTALAMLVEAGLPIEDAALELERIEAEDFEGAIALLEATGDEQAARDRLGLEGEPPPAPGTTAAAAPPGGIVTLPAPAGAPQPPPEA
jgi:hypothetical protein